MSKSLDTFILFISGFRRKEGGNRGMARLYDEIREYRREVGASNVRVEFERWNCNWEDKANYIGRLLFPKSSGDKKQVIIVSYSYGTGWGARTLCEHLYQDYTWIEVPLLISCDGVYRGFSGLLKPLNVYSLYRNGPLAPEIKLTPNVQNVVYFLRNRNHWFSKEPAGHKIISPCVQDVVKAPHYIQTEHSEADDHRSFKISVTTRLKEFIK